MLVCRLIFGLLLLPFLASRWARILGPAGAAIGYRTYTGFGNQGQQRLIHASHDANPNHRGTRRVNVIQQPRPGNGLELGENGQDGEDYVELNQPMEDMEDRMVMWLRALVFASQKIKIEELEAKLKAQDTLDTSAEDRNSEMARKLAEYRDRLEIAERERDEAIGLMKMIEIEPNKQIDALKLERDQAILERDKAIIQLDGTKSMNDRFLRGSGEKDDQLKEKDQIIIDLNSKLDQANAGIRERDGEINFQKELRLGREEAMQDALNTTSLDVVGVAKALKLKADKRKKKLVDAREELNKGRGQIEYLEQQKKRLNGDFKVLENDLEEAKENQVKAEKLKADAEDDLEDAKFDLEKARKELEQKGCALGEANQTIESKEATCQILSFNLEQLQIEVNGKTAKLEKADSDLKETLEALGKTFGDLKKKSEELHSVKTEVNKLQDGKLDIALALGHCDNDLGQVQFLDLVEIIRSHQFRLKDVLEEKTELKQIAGGLLAKLEYVAHKLGTEWDRDINGKMDEFLDELAREQKSNKEVNGVSKDLRVAAFELDEAHEQVCKERDQLASNQTLLIQKLRAMTDELDEVRREYLRTLTDQHASQFTEDSLLKSLSVERAEIHTLKAANFSQRVDNQRLVDLNLDQKEKIDVLAEKKQDLEEKLAQALAELKETLGESKKAQATIHVIQAQFEDQQKKFAELQKQFEALQSELKETRLSISKRDQVIERLKSAIDSLNDSKTKFMVTVGGVFDVQLSEENVAQKLTEILERHHENISSLKKNLVAVTEDRAAIEKSLMEEMEALRHEMTEERENDNVLYQVNLGLHAMTIADLVQYTNALEYNNKGLDWNVRNRIASIKKLQKKLEDSEKKSDDLSKDLDEMTAKYVEAQEDYGSAMEALNEMTSTAKANKELLEATENRLVKITSDRDHLAELSSKQEADRLITSALPSNLTRKLEKKKLRLAEERQKVSTIKKVYIQDMMEVEEQMQRANQHVEVIEGKADKLGGVLETTLEDLQEKNIQLSTLQNQYNKATETVAELEKELSEESTRLKEAAEKNQADLSKKLDEMLYEYLDAETNYEMVLAELVENQQDYEEALDALSVANEKMTDLIKERDEAVDQQNGEAHNMIQTRLAAINAKLDKKKDKLAKERHEASGIAQAYEQALAGLNQKIQDDLAEKRRLAKEVLDEKLARQITEVDVEALKEQVDKLEGDKKKLESELLRLATLPPQVPIPPIVSPVAAPVAPVLHRCPSCDDCECDAIMLPRPIINQCTSVEISELVEARAKTLAKADLEQCKNVKVANVAFFGSGLACLGAASGLVGYWFIKLKPLIAVAAAA